MIKHLYSYFNVQGGFFGPVFVSDNEPKDYPEVFKEQVCCTSKNDLGNFLNTDIYCLGEYDNITGQITPCKDFICHCGEIIYGIYPELKGGAA